MKSFKIFAVEDDVWYGSLLEYHLSLNPDYEVEASIQMFSFIPKQQSTLHTTLIAHLSSICYEKIIDLVRKQRIFSLFYTAIIVTFLLIILTITTQIRIAGSNTWVNHTYQVLQENEKLLS